MAGNSQRKGAIRKAGTKKGAVVGSGGQARRALKGRGPTPSAVERPHHPGCQAGGPCRQGRDPRHRRPDEAARRPYRQG